MKKSTNRLIVFLTIALVWSLVWVTNKESVFKYVREIPSLPFYFLGIIPVIGVLIGSLITRKQLPGNEMSLGGKDNLKACIIVAVPIACLSVVGLPNDLGIQPNLFALIMSCFTMLYAVLEEFGWRGYLQEELIRKYNKWLTYTVVGLIWYLWHWYFFREGGNPRLVMIPILIFASFGIGEVAKGTKSILICGALHGLVNILLIYGLIALNISNQEKLIILIVSLVVWIPVIRQIDKKGNVASA